MQLLITLKGIEDLGQHLPDQLNPKKLIWSRLWDFNEFLLNELLDHANPTEGLECVYMLLSFDLQCLYKTFEVTLGKGIDAQKLAAYWKEHEAILLVEMIDE